MTKTPSWQKPNWRESIALTSKSNSLQVKRNSLFKKEKSRADNEDAPLVSAHGDSEDAPPVSAHADNEDAPPLSAHGII